MQCLHQMQTYFSKKMQDILKMFQNPQFYDSLSVLTDLLSTTARQRTEREFINKNKDGETGNCVNMYTKLHQDPQQSNAF